jgi:hypothetical protein
LKFNRLELNRLELNGLEFNRLEFNGAALALPHYLYCDAQVEGDIQLILDSQPQPLVVLQQAGYSVPYQLQTPQPKAPDAEATLERVLERELKLELERTLERTLERGLEATLALERELTLAELRVTASAAISLSDNALPTTCTSSKLPDNKGSATNWLLPR